MCNVCYLDTWLFSQSKAIFLQVFIERNFLLKPSEKKLKPFLNQPIFSSKKTHKI